MTRINKIVMQGFKSFAKTTEIPFGPGFNVVLGPNGSGKSNVTDAICFVLGKLSAKGLRAEKQANLIYDGGKTKAPAKFASVAIHFENSGKEFPYPEKEIVIVRKVLPTGTSVYKINNVNSSRKEILDLLGLAKIDPDGYNIILQGDISKFVEMSPENRRLVIEEIADITLYEDKKRQALLELARVDEKLKEAKIVLTERKTYLDELRVEHDQAVKYKDMTTKIDQNKATHFHLQIVSKKDGLESVEKRSEKLDLELGAGDKRLKEMDGEIAGTQGKIEDVNREIEQKGEKGQVELHKHIEDLKVEISSNSARVESCKEELSKIKQRREGLKRQKDELDDRLSALDKEAKLLDSDSTKLRQEQGALEKKLKELRQKFNVEDTAQIDGQVSKLDNECDALSNAILALREKQQDLLRRKDSIEMQLGNIEQRIEKISEVEAGNKKELERLRAIKNKFKQVTVELNKRLNDDSAMAVRLAGLRDQYLSAREELAKANERKVSLTEQISGNIAIKKILELKGKMPTIHGTVSSLASVKSKYSLALDVAAGSHLKDIVVEDDETAVKCIKYLKENRLGVATFLPMNKLRLSLPNPKVKEYARADGTHGMAIELLKYDPRFANVFKWVFRETLVVDNIDVARRLGVGNARIVTLDGDLVEMSGAMIGGFRNARKSSLGFQEEEVSKHQSDVETKVAALGKQVEMLEKDRRKSEDIIVALKHEKAELEAEIIKTERSLHLESDDLNASSKEREVLKANLKAVGTELAELLKQISKETTELTSKKMEKERLKQRLSVVRDPRLLAEINSYDEKIRRIREELLGLEGRLKNNRSQSEEVYKKELDRVVLVLKQLEKEELGFSGEISKKSDGSKLLDKELKEMEKKAEVFYSKYKELFKTRNALGDRLKDIEVAKAALSEQLRGVEQKKNSLSLDRATLKAQIAGLEEEFAPFKGVELLKEKGIGELRREIDKFEAMVATFGNVNLKALEIYDQVEAEYKNLLEKRERLMKEKEDVEGMMTEIEHKKKGLFLESFERLDKDFQKFFSKLSTKEGEAHLVLENAENPFDGGVEIKVKRAGKRYVDLRSLSGGEKAMTALALIFAIQEYEPATFYIMDEVEAALDKQNSEKLGKLIKKYSEKAQYIVISHNDYVIQESDTLFGVSMTEHGISKVVSLRV